MGSLARLSRTLEAGRLNHPAVTNDIWTSSTSLDRGTSIFIYMRDYSCAAFLTHDLPGGQRFRGSPSQFRGLPPSWVRIHFYAQLHSQNTSFLLGNLLGETYLDVGYIALCGGVLPSGG